MFGSEILDVVVGLIFIFLLLSLMCSAVKEMFETWMKKRAVDLEKGIRVLLDDLKGDGLAKKLYDHPLVYCLFHGDYDPEKIKNGKYPRCSNLPSYIPSSTFALALMDIVASNIEKPPAVAAVSAAPVAPVVAATPNPLKPFLDAIEQLSNEEVKQALKALANTAENDVGKLRENIEAWYDSSMERVSGWYKRNNQKVLLLFASIITIGMNVNTIDIANHLFRDKALRDSLVAQADAVTKEDHWQDKGFSDIDKKIQEIGLPIGWSKIDWSCPRGAKTTTGAATQGGIDKVIYIVWNCILLRFFGWSITIFAISMGAPFWFDLLGKFMKIRSTIKPGKKSDDKPAGD